MVECMSEKICPIMSMLQDRGYTTCQKEKCQWWVVVKKGWNSTHNPAKDIMGCAIERIGVK